MNDQLQQWELQDQVKAASDVAQQAAQTVQVYHQLSAAKSVNTNAQFDLIEDALLTLKREQRRLAADVQDIRNNVIMWGCAAAVFTSIAASLLLQQSPKPVTAQPQQYQSQRQGVQQGIQP
jgi:hypothetical protein